MQPLLGVTLGLVLGAGADARDVPPTAPPAAPQLGSRPPLARWGDGAATGPGPGATAPGRAWRPHPIATPATQRDGWVPGADDGWAGGAEANGPPPPGWKSFTPKDRTYSIWVPAQPRSQRERERSVTIRGQPLKMNILTVEMPNGMAYLAQELILPNTSTRDERAAWEDGLRDLFAQEIGGRVTVEDLVTVGTVPGKEYRIEAGRVFLRMRVFAAGNWVLSFQALGAREQVETDAVRAFFNSCRLAPGPRSAGAGGPVGADRRTTIQGGFNDPEFVDEAPPGGLLVGAEVGLGRFGNNPVSHAARPIYRVGGRDVEGAWHGPTAGKQFVRAVAQPGYAVGAVKVKNGLTVDGFSFTFMRVADGRLDPLDSYESAWLGGPGGGGPVTLGGDGRLVVGLIGKAKDDALTGLGLLFPDPVWPVPVASPAPLPVAATPAAPAPSPLPPAAPVPQQAAPTGPTVPPAEKSRWPLVLGGALGGVVLVLAVLGGLVLIARQGRGGARRRRRDEDDEDDDDYPRSGNRRRGRYR